MTSIVTKTGDKGDTGLYGAARVQKDHPRIAAIGAVDELNALFGVVLAESDLPARMKTEIEPLQHLLFRVGADLATPLDSPAKTHRVEGDHVTMLETRVKAIEPTLPAQKAFLLPGGNRVSALLHHARAVCRRAEREVVTLKRKDTINDQVLVFLNRLSDLLFLLARKANVDEGSKEVEVKY
jgi:cob(I)alamin adenosyltransferase